MCVQACVAEGEEDSEHDGPCTRRFLKAGASALTRHIQKTRISKCLLARRACVRAGDVCRTWQPDNLCVCVPLCTADSNHLNWNEPDLCNFPCDGHGWYNTSPTVRVRVIQEAKVYSFFSKARKCSLCFTLKYHGSA